MKYLESFADQSYKKKYILVKARTERYSYHIIENLYSENYDQFNKLYDITSDGTVRKLKDNFYFTLNQATIEENMIYQSDILEDVVNKVELLSATNKYNI